MATLSQTKSQKKYSWWWDSHIPKNSRWLQENLTDMDSKVKSMIKLIEEDADSFARRAEMYYKKRPELMKLVEEFYRAYRALAERYDHATGALRQAQRTMSEAFPNQMHMMLPDDSPGNSAYEADPRTPDSSTPVRSFFESDDVQKNDSGISPSRASKKNGAFREASEALKQLNSHLGSGGHAKFAEGRVRKGLNFQDDDESELAIKSEREIATLKEAIAKLEAEKEASQKQYQQNLESLSKLEAAVSRAQEDSREFNEKASKAELETQALKDALIKLEAEKEASLLQYQMCLDNISNLENILQHAQKDSEKLDERANKAETEVQTLKQDLAREEAEKDDALNQYKQSLEMVSVLESKLLLAEESARKHSECAEVAEGEVETLKQAILKLNDEKEAAALQYQQCLETISCLELKISGAHEGNQRLNDKINIINEKLKVAEERCALLEMSNHSLHSELETAMLKLGNQNQELTEKQKELARLWECVQEERLRFMEAETAFQTLQCLHSQAQDELRSLALELHNRSQTLRDMETHNESLQEELLKIKEENKSLNELNQSSTMSMEGMQDELFSLRQMTGKLEEEVELQVDQRNALQQEIYCLKQELKDLNDKHHTVLKQVEAVGFNPECIEVSVKKLQAENSNLSEIFQKEKNERVALIQKLEIFEKLLEKNALLENSLADLSVELDAVRGKIAILEESCESLLLEKSTLVDEKATLMTQLQLATDNLGKLAETNTSLQISLSSAHNELEEIKAKTKSLEDSCMLLVNQKSCLISEKDVLASEFKIAHQRLEDSEKRFAQLEEKCSVLEKEKNSTLDEAQELRLSLEAKKQEHDSFTQTSARELAGLETQIQLLQEERRSTNRELEDELDNALNSHLEIFVLQKCVQDIREKSLSLLIECQKLSEAYNMSEICVSNLEQENVEQKVELKSLSDQLNILRIGMSQLLMACDIVSDPRCDYKNGQGVKTVDRILRNFQDTKLSLFESLDENQLLTIELSVLVTLLKEMRSEAADIAMEKSVTDQELSVTSEQCLIAQSEVRKLSELTGKLRLELTDGCQKEKELMCQIENLTQRLYDNEKAYAILLHERTQALDENRALVKELSQLEEKNCTIEEENFALFGEMLSSSLLSLILKNYVDDRSLNVIEIGEDLSKLCFVNTSLEKNLHIKEKKLEDVQTENMHLQETVQKSMDKLQAVTCVLNHLSHEIATLKNLFHQKEMELLEAEGKLTVKEDENSGLTKTIEDLKSKDDADQMVIEVLEKKIIKLEEDNNHLSEENICLGEANQNLEVQFHHLHDTHETTKHREVSLCFEMQKRDEEIDIWEKQASTFYGEFQASTLAQTLLLEKVRELIEECKGLRGEITSKDVKMELLAKNISTMESKNEELEAQLALYGPAVASLMDSISSMEKHTFLHAHLEKTISEEVKGTYLANQQLSVIDSNEDNFMVPDAILNMQHLQARVKAIESTVLEMESLAMEENLHLRTKLEAALKQIDETSSENHEHAAIVKRPTSEISEETGLPKDIMLDHISETSSYGISKRRYDGSDIQVHELWETTDQESSIDLSGGKGKNIVSAPNKNEHSEATKQKRQHFSSDSIVEKALGVDKLDISKRFTQPHQDGNKRKVLERLNSDVLKLTNLQITVQDLKRKLESIEKSRKGKANSDTDTMKRKLEEAEAAIQKLFDFNGKLMKNIEDNSSQTSQKSAMESEESGSARRKKISEQALRVSERIGRLQLEIQRIQFELLKLDDGKESKGKIRIVESKRRVLLRDYLYGGIRKNPKRKKAPFCGCVEPKTKED